MEDCNKNTNDIRQISKIRGKAIERSGHCQVRRLRIVVILVLYPVLMEVHFVFHYFIIMLDIVLNVLFFIMLRK